MYRIPFVDAHLSKISLWCELYGCHVAQSILFRCEENI